MNEILNCSQNVSIAYRYLKDFEIVVRYTMKIYTCVLQTLDYLKHRHK